MTRMGRMHFARLAARVMVALSVFFVAVSGAAAADPVKVGFSMSMTGAVAPNGRSTLTITPSVEAPTKMVFYLVSPSRAVGIPADAGANMLFGANPTLGVIEK